MFDASKSRLRGSISGISLSRLDGSFHSIEEITNDKKFQAAYANQDFPELARLYSKLYERLEKHVKLLRQVSDFFSSAKFCLEFKKIQSFNEKPNSKQIKKWYYKIYREYMQLRKIYPQYASKCNGPVSITWFCHFFGTPRPIAENRMFGYLYKIREMYEQLFKTTKKALYYENNPKIKITVDLKSFEQIARNGPRLDADYVTERFLRNLFVKQLSVLDWDKNFWNDPYNCFRWPKSDGDLYKKIKSGTLLPFLLVYKNKNNLSRLVDDTLSRANLTGNLFDSVEQKSERPELERLELEQKSEQNQKQPNDKQALKYKHDRRNFMLTFDLNEEQSNEQPYKRMFHPEWYDIVHAFVPIFPDSVYLKIQLLFILLVHKGIVPHSPNPPTKSQEIIDLLLKSDFEILVLGKAV